MSSALLSSRAGQPRRWLELLAFASALAFAGCSARADEGAAPSNSSASQPGATERPSSVEGAGNRRRVEVATIQVSDATIRLRLPGEIQGWREAFLAAPLGGYVERVQVSNGDRVRRNQVLARVDAATQGARVAQTQVELAASERERARAERLGDAIPMAQRDAAETREAAARAAHRAAQVAAGRSVIRAPFDGTIAAVEAEVGEVAAPGQTLMRLVHLDKVKVTVSVADRDVVALTVGMPARIVTDARAGVFEGRISHINPAADGQTRAFSVEIEVENEDHRLLPGMIANVTVEERVASGELLVPQDWIVTKLDGLGVFLEHDGRAVWRSVDLGRVVGTQVVVSEGLSEGDRVIVTGHRELADEDLVRVVREGVCCTAGRVTY